MIALLILHYGCWRPFLKFLLDYVSRNKQLRPDRPHNFAGPATFGKILKLYCKQPGDIPHCKHGILLVVWIRSIQTLFPPLNNMKMRSSINWILILYWCFWLEIFWKSFNGAACWWCFPINVTGPNGATYLYSIFF